MQMTVIENQPGMTSAIEYKPYVIGVTDVNGRSSKRVLQSISYANIGLVAQATVRVTPEGPLALELDIEDERAAVPEDSPLIGVDEKGDPIRATEFTKAHVTTTVTLQSGHAAVLKDIKTASKSGQERTIVIVGARITSDEAKANDELPSRRRTRRPK